MKFNKDKRIGHVLFVVEGEKTEFSLLQRIFCNILQYDMIEDRRNGKSYFRDNKNIYNKVAVINASSSNISAINESDYLDAVFQKLIDVHKFPVDKSAIFFLFDRDPKSNTDALEIDNLLSTLKDPYDNDINQAGLLLLSYPSIEAFTISNFEDTSCLCFEKGSDVKAYLNQNKQIQLNKISEETLLYATEEFYKYIKENCSIELDLDNISAMSKEAYVDQSEYYQYTSTYKLFSMLTAAFLYLGIIELKN